MLSERRSVIALKKAFYSPNSPVAFASLSALIRQFKNKIDPNFIQKWIEQQPLYSLNRHRKNKFIRRKAFAQDIGFFHADLSPHSRSIAQANKNCNQLLVICDTLSRKLDAVLIPNKNSDSMIKGMKQLLKRNKITILYTDRGLEFKSAAFEQFLLSNNIKHFYARNTHKAFLAELAIRRIRERIHKYIQHTRNKSFYSVLPALVDGLNSQYNRNLKFAANQVTNPTVKKQVFQNLYFNYIKKPRILPKLSVGDKVRIAVKNTDFSKNYSRHNFSKEVFTVSKVFPTKIPVYGIKDLKNIDIIGTWYSQELVKINEN